MLPAVAIIGRPNVGKSTLFNHLTGARDALVADQPGVTRDRNYGVARCGEHRYIAVDTGGYIDGEDEVVRLAAEQSRHAETEADVILFMLDAREGLNALDQAIADRLRRYGKPVLVAVNKVDGLDPEMAASEFYDLALGRPWPITAKRGGGVSQLMEAACGFFPTEDSREEDELGHRVKFAVIGRPNVGKSTLVNHILGEERVIAHDQPGTTRDSIHIPFDRGQKPYLIIDTAGVRRRPRVTEGIEKFSVIKTLQAIDACHVVVMLLDARTGITDQDARLLGMVLDAGRGLVLAVNKWDALSASDRERLRDGLARKTSFVDFASTHFISALRGWGIGTLLRSVNEAWSASHREIPTPALTRVLREAIIRHPPPIVRGRRIKLRYAHQGGVNPPLVVIHGNQTEATPEPYRRYLIRAFRDAFELYGTAIRIELKTGENPYKGRRNVPTERQARRRRRVIRHSKKKKKKKN